MHQFTFPPTVYEGSLFSTLSPAFIICRVFNVNHSVIYLIVILICVFLIIRHNEHLFVFLLAVCSWLIHFYCCIVFHYSIINIWLPQFIYHTPEDRYLDCFQKIWDIFEDYCYEHFCMCILEECLFRASAHFLIEWFGFFLYLSYMSCLCILETHPLLSSVIYKYFLPVHRLSFCFVYGFFCCAKAFKF